MLITPGLTKARNKTHDVSLELPNMRKPYVRAASAAT